MFIFEKFIIMFLIGIKIWMLPYSPFGAGGVATILPIGHHRHHPHHYHQCWQHWSGGGIILWVGVDSGGGGGDDSGGGQCEMYSRRLQDTFYCWLLLISNRFPCSLSFNLSYLSSDPTLTIASSKLVRLFETIPDADYILQPSGLGESFI